MNTGAAARTQDSRPTTAGGSACWCERAQAPAAAGAAAAGALERCTLPAHDSSLPEVRPIDQPRRRYGGAAIVNSEGEGRRAAAEGALTCPLRGSHACPEPVCAVQSRCTARCALRSREGIEPNLQQSYLSHASSSELSVHSHGIGQKQLPAALPIPADGCTAAIQLCL